MGALFSSPVPEPAAASESVTPEPAPEPAASSGPVKLASAESPEPAPVPVKPAPAPAPAPSSGTITLKDVTLRPLVFGFQKDLELEINPNAKKSFMKGTFKYKLKYQVDKSKFDKYIHVLKIMAQLARIVYCDLSIIRDVVLGKNFGHDNNKVVNDEITVRDKARSSERTVPADPAKNNGRPMKSYVEPPCKKKTNLILTYVSSPSDVTFVVLGGTQLMEKNDFFKGTDIVISFKGSSTMKNFKHDLYSQFQALELAELMPAGVKFNPVGKVTGAFVKTLMKSWDILKEEINQRATTPECRLFITGHSLGGAYASLFAFIVAECRTTHFPNIGSVHLVTFGAPTLLSDTARNNFNRHLNNGFLTLDRVTSETNAGIPDPIPIIPVGFSQPGYRPLKTEWRPENDKGRAYQLANLVKLFVRPPSQGGRRNKTQRGGAFFVEKNKYEAETVTHMPTLILIEAITLKGQTFAHAEYFDMTYFGAFRGPGMKNPGYKEGDKRYTFVGRVYEDGIAYEYKEKNEPGDTSAPAPDPDPTDKTDMAAAGAGAPKGEVEAIPEAIPDEANKPEAIPDEANKPEAIPEKAIPKVPEAIPKVPEAIPEAIPKVPEAIPEAIPEVPEAIPEVNKPEVNKPAYDYDTYGPKRADFPAGEEGYAEYEEAFNAWNNKKKQERANKAKEEANKAKEAIKSTLPKMQSGPGVNKPIITNETPSISVVGGSRRTSQRRRTARKINKRKNKNKSIRKQKK